MTGWVSMGPRESYLWSETGRAPRGAGRCSSVSPAGAWDRWGSGPQLLWASEFLGNCFKCACHLSCQGSLCVVVVPQVPHPSALPLTHTVYTQTPLPTHTHTLKSENQSESVARPRAPLLRMVVEARTG